MTIEDVKKVLDMVSDGDGMVEKEVVRALLDMVDTSNVITTTYWPTPYWPSDYPYTTSTEGLEWERYCKKGAGTWATKQSR